MRQRPRPETSVPSSACRRAAPALRRNAGARRVRRAGVAGGHGGLSHVLRNLIEPASVAARCAERAARRDGSRCGGNGRGTTADRESVTPPDTCSSVTPPVILVPRPPNVRLPARREARCAGGMPHTQRAFVMHAPSRIRAPRRPRRRGRHHRHHRQPGFRARHPAHRRQRGQSADHRPGEHRAARVLSSAAVCGVQRALVMPDRGGIRALLERHPNASTTTTSTGAGRRCGRP